jgi:hypothetical protein
MRFQVKVGVLPGQYRWKDMPIFSWWAYRKTHRTRIIIFQKGGPARKEK